MNNNSHIEPFTRTIVAGGTADIEITGNGFAVLSMSGANSVHVGFENSGNFKEFLNGTSMAFPFIFKTVRLKNENAVQITVNFLIFTGNFSDNRFQVSAPINIDTAIPLRIADGFNVSERNENTILSGGVITVASDNLRKSCRIINTSAALLKLHIPDIATDAAGTTIEPFAICDLPLQTGYEIKNWDTVSGSVTVETVTYI